MRALIAGIWTTMKPWLFVRLTVVMLAFVSNVLACAPSLPEPPRTVTPAATIRASTPTVPARTPVAETERQPELDKGTQIALAAQAQVGVTTTYDPQYVRLDYPNGDVPLERGVCTDVVVRAFRTIGVDLQVRVHEDMKKSFALYPKDWGMTSPDRNIDHRRVQNLTKYFERAGKQVKTSDADENFKPGDVVAWQLDSWMQHIGIVAAEKVDGTNRYYMIHNIGAGTQKEDVLHSYTIIGHYRW
jgi:uncharacterized protein YijF (DUF1287 family)